ncbi:MAG: hypothetical protein ABEN55_08445 [Bradymonadaceae bacterium]
MTDRQTKSSLFSIGWTTLAGLVMAIGAVAVTAGPLWMDIVRESNVLLDLMVEPPFPALWLGVGAIVALNEVVIRFFEPVDGAESFGYGVVSTLVTAILWVAVGLVGYLTMPAPTGGSPETAFIGDGLIVMFVLAAGAVVSVVVGVISFTMAAIR